MVGIGDRLDAAMKARKVSVSALAKAVGLSYQGIKKAVDGKTKEMDAANLLKISGHLQVNPEWLRTGRGSRDLVTTNYDSVMEEASKYSEFLPGFEPLSIPLLAQAGSMGHGTDLMHDEVVVGRLTVSPQWVTRVVKPTKADNLRFIHGYGDSMEPTFSDGDILLVDLGLHDPKVDGVYVLEANDRIYIKRVRQRLDGQYEISSDNPTVKTVDVLNGDHQVKVHGKVVWAWNGKKM